MKRRDFLKKIGKISIGTIVGGGLFYKACIDQFVNYPEYFYGFDEEKKDGWEISDFDIPTSGDVIAIGPGREIEKEVISENEVVYRGDILYRIRRKYLYTPKEYLRDKRKGYIRLKKKKQE